MDNVVAHALLERERVLAKRVLHPVCWIFTDDSLTVQDCDPPEDLGSFNPQEGLCFGAKDTLDNAIVFNVRYRLEDFPNPSPSFRAMIFLTEYPGGQVEQVWECTDTTLEDAIKQTFGEFIAIIARNEIADIYKATRSQTTES